MAKLSTIRMGLNIFSKYDKNDTSCAAEHDVFYAGETPPEEISEEDKETLEDLGWGWDKGFNCWYHFT